MMCPEALKSERAKSICTKEEPKLRHSIKNQRTKC